MDISCTDLLWSGHVILKVYFLTQVHLTCQSLIYKAFLPSIGHWELNFTIESARSEECWIESISSVGRHDNFHIYCLIKAIHLLKKFNQDSLNLSISTSVSIKTFSGNRIDFINEDNIRSIVLSHSEDIPHHPRAFTQIFLNKLRPNHPDKGSRSLIGHCLSQHGLPRAWRAIQ